VTDPTGLRVLPPVDVLDVLGPERAALCELLSGLDSDAWARPTECPAWTVQGVALHVLGDDLSLLSRQRDAATPSLFLEGSLPEWPGAPESVLDRFNERWVHAATFLSPRLLVDLLDRLGTLTLDFYATVDPDSVGEPVMLFGMTAAPYRSIAAREYLERWVHHLQIRRALGLAAGPLAGDPLGPRGVEVVARAVASLVAFVMPSTDRTVAIEFGSTAFTYVHDPASDPASPHGWAPRAGRGSDPTVSVSVAEDDVVTLVSRGLSRTDAAATLHVTAGDPELGRAVTDGMAAAMSAYYVEL